MGTRINDIFLLISVIQGITALIPLPVTEDLLGPGQCPAGSFCIEIAQCTNEFFTTKSGMPFYCGPNHQIDAMTCCVSIATETVPEPLDRTVRGQPEEFNEEDSPRTRYNRTTEEDDELDILSLPFPDNQVYEDSYDLPMHDTTEEFENSLTGLDDMESFLEGVPDTDLNGNGAHEDVRNVLDAILSNIPTEAQYKEAFPESRDPLLARFTGGNLDPLSQFVDPVEANEYTYVDSRTFPHQQRSVVCPCEKGEKGDVGPKGEPGKIIYIPVFVNTAGNLDGLGSPIGGVGNPGTPFQLSPTLTNQPPQQYYSQGPVPIIPQNPNPTVVPYNIPINLQAPPSNPTSPPFSSQQTPQSYNIPIAIPQYAIQQQQPIVHSQPQQPSSIQYVDGSESRLTRHLNDNRFAPRRY